MRAQASRVRSCGVCVSVGLCDTRTWYSVAVVAVFRSVSPPLVVVGAARSSYVSRLVLVSPRRSFSRRRQRRLLRLPLPRHPPPAAAAVIIVVDVAPLSRSRRRPPHRRRPRDEPGPAATQDGCVSLTRGGQTGQPVDISGTCGYAIVRPVPEERDTGQEARGEFLLLSLDTYLPLLLSASFAIFFLFFFFLLISNDFRLFTFLTSVILIHSRQEKNRCRE